MSLTGRAVVLTLLGLLAVPFAPRLLTAVVWLLLVAVIVAADVALAARISDLRLVRVPLDPVHLDEDTATSLVVHHGGRRHARGVLRDAWQPSAGARIVHDLDLAPGEETTLLTPLHPTRRGHLAADRVTVRLHGPLGVAARQRSVPVPGALPVLPRFPSRRHLPGLLHHLQLLDGRATVRTPGQGTEFDSLRDYVRGDDVRSIDWRATARRHHAVVRTWRPERDRHVVLVVDTSRTSAARIGDVPRLDAAMDAALLLTALATRGGDRVDVVAGDRVVRCLDPGGRGASGPDDRLHRLVDALAPLEPSLVEANWPMLAAATLRLASRGALVVLLTPLEPVVVEETLLPALEALGDRHTLVLASVRDPGLDHLATGDPRTAGATRDDDLDAVHDAAAAEHALARRARTAAVLTGLDVTVLDRPPADLPVDLAHTYLDLKARGRL
ncbi:DUF58 domain-containing protein [Mobilicoccus pelagius]|uniref:DUF58 domain-containing protein n=1 Tax=Mobilicoccus pelagius NBRC 104925 TaxID=1089455 RepID=H5UU09_9MICO|nr:DUF58 domain-containing protein [Mobilicoccus pelagius]GAB49217.1 hypothetical protein MOPEL_099_00170 [Mobilicoccus pelagius NBRC 104925]